MQFHTTGRITTFTLALMAMAASLAPGVVTAQMSEDPQVSQQLRLQEIQQTLAALQQQVITENEELQEQNEALDDLVTEKMVESGFDPHGSAETLAAIEESMQDEEISPEQRDALMRQAQEAQRELYEGQQVAMQDTEVQQAQAEFREELVSAMREQDPSIDELIEEFSQIQLEMRNSTPAPDGHDDHEGHDH